MPPCAVSPANAGIGLGDQQLDVIGHLDRDGLLTAHEHGDGVAFLQIRQGVGQGFLRQRDLLVGLGVHERQQVAVVVEVLVIARFSRRTSSTFSPARKVLSTTLPLLDVLELRAHEGAALARLHVLELDDGQELTVDLA